VTCVCYACCVMASGLLTVSRHGSCCQFVAQALKEEELVRLLTEPRGALCKQYLLQFDLNDAGFVMTEVRHQSSCRQCHWAGPYGNSRPSSVLMAVHRCARVPCCISSRS